MKLQQTVIRSIKTYKFKINTIFKKLPIEWNIKNPKSHLFTNIFINKKIIKILIDKDKLKQKSVIGKERDTTG